jgi:CubicO group peptidase (beta-lactamase class C family)
MTNNSFKMKQKLLLFAILFINNINAYSQSLATSLNNIANSYDIMGGAVVVFCESGINETHYFGKSDNTRNFNVTENTKFRIASISKTITAIGIMQLVEQNLMGLDDDISQILGYAVVNPNYPNVTITPRMLLSHTSTIIDGTTYSSFLTATVNNNPIPNLSELLTTGGNYYTAGLFNNTVPGNYFNYSNTNYVILGTILEKISNLRFDVYCKQNIFQPLGLDASFNVNDLQSIDSVAVLYRKPSGIWTAQQDNYQGVPPIFNNLAGYIPGTNGGRFGPQGGLRISAEDLATIFMCLNNNNFCAFNMLNAASVANMVANEWTYNGSNGNNYYGLFRSWGLGIHRITSTPNNDIALPGSAVMFGHTGEAYGLVSDAYFDTIRKVGFVFITNGVGTGYVTGSSSAFYTVEKAIFDAIENDGNLQNCLVLDIDEEKKAEEKFSIYPNPGNELIHIVGNLNPKELNTIKIYGIDGSLINQVSQSQTINITQLSKGIYFIQINNQRVKFVKN